MLTSFFKLIERRYWIFVLVLFFLTRFVIVFFPTAEYTDVTHYYERYANFWRYGMTPYFEHLYEYPPASIPILYLPLELDQQGLGKYYLNYRVETFVIETILFLAMWATVKKFWPQFEVKRKTLLIYIGLTFLSIDWLYEGIDLTFTSFSFFSYLALLWLDIKKFKHKIVIWVLFWLSTAIKFLTLPLIVPLYLVSKTDWKKDLLAVMIGFVLVWGGPLLYFRSSLSVSLVYNAQRPLKYSSFPAYLIRWVDIFTESESQSQREPDFEFVGPVSTKVTQAVKVIYPASILAVLALASYLIWQTQFPKQKVSLTMAQLTQWFQWIFQPTKLTPAERFVQMLRAHALYLFVTFFTAKIFSQPFHLWSLPLLVLYPFNQKDWPKVIAAMTLMLLIDLTPWLAYPTWVREWLADQGLKADPNIFRDALRYLPMMGILAYFLTRTPELALRTPSRTSGRRSSL